VTGEWGLFKTVWRFGKHFFVMPNIKIKYAFGRSFLAQFAPHEKSEVVRYKICFFIKVFAMMADR